MSGFRTPLIFQDLGNCRFQLTAPLVYDVSVKQRIVVPAGFVTDLASIPRALYLTTPQIGNYDAPAVVHDFLYAQQITTRAEADGIFRQAMSDAGVGRYTRTKMWLAVRLFGGSIWERHKADLDDAA